MSKSARPEGVTWVLPFLTVLDVEEAARFYQQAFQFGIKELVPSDDKTIGHGELKYKDQLIMLGKQGAYGKTSQSPVHSKVECPMGLYLYCEDVDQFHANAVKHGAISVEAPDDMFWGDRMCRLKDLDGYVWCFATYIGEHK